VEEPAHEGSPVAIPAKEGRRGRARRNAAIRKEEARLAPYLGLARIIIKHRLAAGITQQELAERMGTSHSAVSRIESGWHTAKPETLGRLAEALDMRFVMGFESGPAENPERELVAV
jgi:ribosome-binding protein aMBF1 (putative translation factor)